MSYRSDQTALQAELATLGAELEQVRAQRREVDRERRARLRARGLLGLPWFFAALSVVFGVLLLSARHAKQQRRAEQAERVMALESEVSELESELATERNAARTVKAMVPLARVLGSMGTAEDPRLFGAIREADPRDAEDAWWIVAHATCGWPPGEPGRSLALERLPKQRAESARRFCSERRPGP